ncbi:hypothetical protein V1477_009592 [Vespula maculifrons]|uniref:Uncharacterized protein n=1 Tax=Vespula maculifrons TaxID=7453 RepID=A0ABD2CCG1_VESMC
MQQPPSGGTWVGSTCDILKSVKLFLKSLIKLYMTTESTLNQSAHGNETRTFKYIEYSRLTFTGRIPNRIPIR